MSFNFCINLILISLYVETLI
nr:unnamed protein product [Callosobruchus chinensis]CAH7733478.1 unnamed protein product [Callosobruchus chinensis]CAH7756515.1 unnamed protein product [Callosobruchus chinensis]